ncbi:hypothetical protein P3S67_031501 [Capsicum chacoense]
MAILTKKSAFCAFVVTDAIAFVCSAGAVFSYFVLAANHRPKTAKELRVLMDIYRVATILQLLSMSAVVIAFITGMDEKIIRPNIQEYIDVVVVVVIGGGGVHLCCVIFAVCGGSDEEEMVVVEIGNGIKRGGSKKI